MDAILFLSFAAVAVACAINLVLQTHPISSALSLIGVMCSLAALYLLLGGEFIAMAQIIVYAGAIMVLFVFVIMLLNTGKEKKATNKALATTLLAGPLVAAFIFTMAVLIQRFPSAGVPVKFGGFTGGTARDIGQSLFSSYLLPFEVTSILILIAIIGAIVLARKELD
jgi:NADH-quinone oxidoreductase subunit J